MVSKTQDKSWKSSQERNEVRTAVQKLYINLRPVLSMFLILTKDMVYNLHAKSIPHIHNYKRYYYNIDLIPRPSV